MKKGDRIYWQMKMKSGNHFLVRDGVFIGLVSHRKRHFENGGVQMAIVHLEYSKHTATKPLSELTKDNQMKSKKSIKVIKKQLIEIFGFSKSNLISLLEQQQEKYKDVMYGDEFKKALRLVKGCSFIPKKGIKTTAKRVVYVRKYNGKKKETTHPIG